MDRRTAVLDLRAKLRDGGVSLGSWMQFRDASVAEVMGGCGYDWVAVDLEHGQFSLQALPDLFRALELGGTLPLARLALGDRTECKRVLDAGAAGVIVPMVTSAEQLESVRQACRWPDAGSRGVAFSRANLFGRNFEEYRSEAQAPLLVAMIEHVAALKDLESILAVDGLDAVLIGPYDLSASMGCAGELDSQELLKVQDEIRQSATDRGVPCGVHVLEPSRALLEDRIAQGDRFLAYSMDAVFLWKSADQTNRLQ